MHPIGLSYQKEHEKLSTCKNEHAKSYCELRRKERNDSHKNSNGNNAPKIQVELPIKYIAILRIINLRFFMVNQVIS